MEENQLNELINCIDLLFHQTLAKIVTKLEEEIAPLTSNQFYILKKLSTKEKCTASELAKNFNVKPSSITSMIDRLEKLNYVVRYRDVDDRRIVFMELTKNGRIELIKKEKIRMNVIKNFFKHLELNELESLISIYEKIVEREECWK